MSDLDKLMEKLKTDKPKAIVPKAEEPKVEEPKAKAEIISPTLPEPKAEEPTPEIEDDDDDDEDVPQSDADPVEPIPANVDEPNPIEHEVALLQNDGVFRRELIFVLKELVVSIR